MLLGYLAAGASAVRLDAIGFLWKESGTTCLHLPQTHAVIKLWRALVDHVAPGARLLTETNVPHAENVSYFGDGHDEAHLVYQFALPPLVLHSFVAGSTARLSDWATGVGPVSDTATWFNFLASHDGIGLRATEGILDDARARRRWSSAPAPTAGGSRMASRPDGTRTVYELNLSYLDALCTVDRGARSRGRRGQGTRRAQHPVRLPRRARRLLPLAASARRPTSRAWSRSRINRRINRAVLDADRLARELRDDPRRRAVFDGCGTC